MPRANFRGQPKPTDRSRRIPKAVGCILERDYETLTLGICIRIKKHRIIPLSLIHILEISHVFVFDWLDTTPAVQSLYSSALNTTSQTYSRNCRTAGYYYETIRMNVIENGNYSLVSISNIYTYGYIYNGNFNPFNPLKNLVAQNDEGCRNGQFKIIVHLQANTSYILVVTTFDPNIIGPFSILVSGPNNVSLNHFRKYLYCCVNNQHIR